MDYAIPGFDNALQSLKPAARTATATGSTIDCLGYDAVEILIDSGTCTDGTHTVSLTESSDDTTYTAVAAGDLEGTFPAIITTNDDQCYTVGYRGTKRYLRPVITVSGSPGTGAIIGIAALRGRKKYRT